jgi:addiction module HigA family antidote
MASFASERDKNRCPTHPGLLLREDILPPLGRPKAEIAKWLSVSRQYLSQILCEDRPVSAGMAVRFGKMFGNEPMMWLRMQAAHDAWHAARKLMFREFRRYGALRTPWRWAIKPAIGPTRCRRLAT